MKQQPLVLSSAIVTDIRKYLTGDMKLKDVKSTHRITQSMTDRIIEHLKAEKNLLTDSDRFKMEERYSPRRERYTLPECQRRPMSAVNPDHVRRMVESQLDSERRVRVMEEACQEVTVDAETFLNSSLVKRQRVFGCD